VVFSLRFAGEERRYDLSDLPFPRLVRPLAQALAEIGGEDGAVRTRSGFEPKLAAVWDFVLFAAAAHAGRVEDLTLADLEPELLDAFERKLISDHGLANSRPPTAMAAVARVLRLAGDNHPGALSTAMLARVAYGMATATEYVKRPLDAYPLPVFERIREAALADVRAIRDRILEGERLAGAGQDPQQGGWGRLENILWHIARHGPITPRHPQARRLERFGFGSTRAVNARLFLTRDDLLAFLVALICHTGLEPECAKGLRADCLTSPAKGYVSLAYLKRRAPGDERKTLRVADGGALHHPGGLLRLAQRLTQRGRGLLGSEALWVEAWDQGLHEPFSRPRSMERSAARFLRRHGLTGAADRGGQALQLDLRRLRKSFKSEQYHRTAGILPDFAVGHSEQTAATHYADIDAHRELHERAVEHGLQEALDAALPPPVVLDEHGQRVDQGGQPLTPEEVVAAMSGQQDVWLASCRDFYDSPFARTKGTGCPVAIWGCLECPNAVFSTRHLPSVLSFLSFTEAQHHELPEAEWKLRYGLAWQRITRGIQPRFTAEQLRTAAPSPKAPGLPCPCPRSSWSTWDDYNPAPARRPDAPACGRGRLRAPCPPHRRQGHPRPPVRRHGLGPAAVPAAHGPPVPSGLLYLARRDRGAHRQGVPIFPPPAGDPRPRPQRRSGRAAEAVGDDRRGPVVQSRVRGPARRKRPATARRHPRAPRAGPCHLAVE